MYMSRIELNTKLKKTARALVNPNLIHGALSCMENADSGRILWRIDSLYGKKYLLTVSEGKVDFSPVGEQFGFIDSLVVKNYDNLIQRVENGSTWRFKLTANPTVKKYDEKRKKSVSLAHITTEYQMKWLIDRAKANGFSVDEALSTVTESKWINFRKNSSGDNVRMLSVTYEGVLTVTDENLFRDALKKGIGREKAYGMGMLTIIR